jgi:hypothetical protein
MAQKLLLYVDMNINLTVKIRRCCIRSLVPVVILLMTWMTRDLDAQSIVPNNRRMDWTPGTAVGIPGGIPHWTNIGANVKNYGAVGDGTNDDTGAIVSALAACGWGSVLYFPTGTYRCNSRINATHGGVVWRGDGMGKTVLMLYSADYIYVGNGDWPVISPTINITAGMNAGSTSLTVDSTTGLGIGKLITITQTNPPWVHANSTYYGAGPSDCGHDATRLMAITVRVRGISGNVVTIEHPLPIDMTNAPMISAWQYVTTSVGFEDMTFNMTHGGGGAGIFFDQAYGCWVKGVEIVAATHRFLWFQQSVNCEVRECYTHDANGGGPNHEGIDFYENCCYNLIEDNVCVRAGYPMIILGDWGGGCVGNVIGYNYLEDLQSGSSVAGYAISDNHGAHNMFNLIEGNIAQNFASDGYYGGSSHGTLFRNYFSGVYNKTNYMWPYAIHLGHWAVNYSVIGNVLGQSGYTATYQETNSSYSSSESVIYRLGYPNVGNTSYSGVGSNPTNSNYYDINVCGTPIWTGNYNYARNTSIWDTNGVQSLPASLYHANQPSWWTIWGNASWPPIGPDRNPMVSQIPAQLRYNAMVAGTNTIGGGTQIPSPPSHLAVQSPAVPLTGGGTCQSYVSVSGSPADWVGNWGTLSQSFTPSATVQICTIKAKLQNASSTSAHFEIRTAANGGGSNLGSSASITPAANSWNTFTFSSPVTVASGTMVYLTYVANGTDIWFLARDSTATGQAYNGSSLADGGNYDWLIEIDAIQ